MIEEYGEAVRCRGKLWVQGNDKNTLEDYERICDELEDELESYLSGYPAGHRINHNSCRLPIHFEAFRGS